MTTGRGELDAAVLQVVLQRLTELDVEVRTVTDIVLDVLPYVDAGAAQAAVTDVGSAVVDAFVALDESLDASLAESRAETQQVTSGPLPAHGRPVEIDLRVVHELDRAAR